jgi:UDP-2,4-diacetamido-2,4,6-trideoxy-beta-L-altropyranose hydrolase
VSTNPIRVAIRADASPQIGLGHIKRCLSLARALIDAGAEVRLVSRDFGFDLHGLVYASGIDRLLLLRPPVDKRETAVDDVTHAAWAGVSWRTDVDDTIAALRGWPADWVVVDHYAFDGRWHRAVGKCLDASIAVIDDLGDRELDAAVLVDQNYSVDHRAKFKHRLASPALILGGPRFALLSPIYLKAKGYEFNERVRSIGIFMGGFDAADCSSVVLCACREQSGFTGPIEIATTHLNPNLFALTKLCEQWPGTTVTIDAEELGDFFARHDLQIGAGGGATWERCCVGVPTLTLPCSENQQVVIPALAHLGILRTTEPPGPLSPERIGRAVSVLLEDTEGRRLIATRSRELVDGLGARRVALCLASDSITLRNAQLGDAELIYAWRNHPSIRRVSRDSAELAWPAHRAWLCRVLTDPRRRLLVGTIGSLPVGVIRLDSVSDVEIVVSLYVDPVMHGIGLGSALLQRGEAYARQSRSDVRRFVAQILEGNIGSQRMFESAGYSRSGEGCWIKHLQIDSGVPS